MTGAEGLLGLCMRARRLVSGEEMCVQSMRRGNACLVLLDAGVSANAKKTLQDACGTHRVPLRRLPVGQLGQAIGKPGRMAAAVTDRGFAERLMELIRE